MTLPTTRALTLFAVRAVVGAALPLACAASSGTPPAPTVAAPPAPPAADYPWACTVTEADERDAPMVVAVKDEGATFKVAMGSRLTGPFRVIDGSDGTKPFRSVLEAKDFADPDLDDTFNGAGVRREDVGTLTSYGIAIHGGWSLGIAIFRDRSGKVIGQSGWRMRLGFARSCGDDAPYAVRITRMLSEQDKACAVDDAGACDRLGAVYETGDGDVLPADPVRSTMYFKRALALHERACENADADACSKVADAYDSGRRGAPRDQARAFAIYDHACEQMFKPEACFNIGQAYEQTQPATAEAYARAARIFDHACARSDQNACEHLARLYAEGQGVAKDGARAAELRARICASGVYDVCNVLGIQYDKGNGVPKDAKRAAALYKKACDANEVAACVNLGEVTADGRGVPRSLAGAVALFKKSCSTTNWGESMGCAGLGLTYEKGLGVPVSRTKAIELYRKGCKGGSEWFCKRLTELGAKP